MRKVRQPAVAGKFYPDDKVQLTRMVRSFLDAAQIEDPIAPKAMIGPHAGYVYSGPIAATGYAHLTPVKATVRRVVLLGPAHWVAVHGLGASAAAAFATPLGEIPLDQASCSEILDLPQVRVSDPAHAPEHSLEVHLPFLQLTLDTFQLIPLVVGDATPAEVAEVLECLWDGPETLIVISSDLSHFEDYDTARRLDRKTARDIETLQPLEEGQACGRRAINGLLRLARRQKLRLWTADLRSSGDTAGPRHQVVGYGAFLCSAN